MVKHASEKDLNHIAIAIGMSLLQHDSYKVWCQLGLTVPTAYTYMCITLSLSLSLTLEKEETLFQKFWDLESKPRRVIEFS
jgi:membrane-associated PAP2 superfamily phosphatase